MPETPRPEPHGPTTEVESRSRSWPSSAWSARPGHCVSTPARSLKELAIGPAPSHRTRASPPTAEAAPGTAAVCPRSTAGASHAALSSSGAEEPPRSARLRLPGTGRPAPRQPHLEHPRVIPQGGIMDIPYIVIDQLVPTSSRSGRRTSATPTAPATSRKASGAAPRRRPPPASPAGRPPTTHGGGSSTTATGTAWCPPRLRRPSA